MDKASWHKIIDNNYQLDQIDELNALTDELIGYLDSPDAELRDTIAYSVLARWIISHQYYSDEQLTLMVERLIPKLSVSLGNHDDDTVFGRSYAVLVLSLLAYQDDRSSFMSESLVRDLLEQARRYLIAEQDHRAYIDGKGWANACANTADLLKFLVRNPVIQSNDAQHIINTIAEKITMQTSNIYQHDEDERLAQVVMTVLDFSMATSAELDEWLKHFQKWKVAHTSDDAEYNLSYHATYQNIKNFLRSLYIQMQLVSSVPMEAVDFEPDLLDIIRDFSL
jgi:hypothetical protein